MFDSSRSQNKRQRGRWAFKNKNSQITHGSDTERPPCQTLPQECISSEGSNLLLPLANTGTYVHEGQSMHCAKMDLNNNAINGKEILPANSCPTVSSSTDSDLGTILDNQNKLSTSELLSVEPAPLESGDNNLNALNHTNATTNGIDSSKKEEETLKVNSLKRRSSSASGQRRKDSQQGNWVHGRPRCASRQYSSGSESNYSKTSKHNKFFNHQPKPYNGCATNTSRAEERWDNSTTNLGYKSSFSAMPPFGSFHHSNAGNPSEQFRRSLEYGDWRSHPVQEFPRCERVFRDRLPGLSAYPYEASRETSHPRGRDRQRSASGPVYNAAGMNDHRIRYRPDQCQRRNSGTFNHSSSRHEGKGITHRPEVPNIKPSLPQGHNAAFTGFPSGHQRNSNYTSTSMPDQENKNYRHNQHYRHKSLSGQIPSRASQHERSSNSMSRASQYYQPPDFGRSGFDNRYANNPLGAENSRYARSNSSAGRRSQQEMRNKVQIPQLQGTHVEPYPSFMAAHRSSQSIDNIVSRAAKVITNESHTPHSFQSHSASVEHERAAQARSNCQINEAKPANPGTLSNLSNQQIYCNGQILCPPPTKAVENSTIFNIPNFPPPNYNIPQPSGHHHPGANHKDLQATNEYFQTAAHFTPQLNENRAEINPLTLTARPDTKNRPDVEQIARNSYVNENQALSLVTNVGNICSESGANLANSSQERECSDGQDIKGQTNPESAMLHSINDEINAEMARAKQMSIPMNHNSTNGMHKSNLNPDAHEFSPVLKDVYGTAFEMHKKGGICYFHPKKDPPPGTHCSCNYCATSVQISRLATHNPSTPGNQLPDHSRQEQVRDYISSLALVEQVNGAGSEQYSQVHFGHYAQPGAGLHGQPILQTARAVDYQPRLIAQLANNPPEPMSQASSMPNLVYAANAGSYPPNLAAFSAASFPNTESTSAPHVTAAGSGLESTFTLPEMITHHAVQTQYASQGYAVYTPQPFTPTYLYAPAPTAQCPPITNFPGNSYCTMFVQSTSVPNLASSVPCVSNPCLPSNGQSLFHAFSEPPSMEKNHADKQTGVGPILNLCEYFAKERLTDSKEFETFCKNTISEVKLGLKEKAGRQLYSSCTTTRVPDKNSVLEDKTQCNLTDVIKWVKKYLKPRKTEDPHPCSEQIKVTPSSPGVKLGANSHTLVAIKEVIEKLLKSTRNRGWKQRWLEIRNQLHILPDKERILMELWLEILIQTIQRIDQPEHLKLNEVLSNVLGHCHWLLITERTTMEELVGFLHLLQTEYDKMPEGSLVDNLLKERKKQCDTSRLENLAERYFTVRQRERSSEAKASDPCRGRLQATPQSSAASVAPHLTIGIENGRSHVASSVLSVKPRAKTDQSSVTATKDSGKSADRSSALTYPKPTANSASSATGEAQTSASERSWNAQRPACAHNSVTDSGMIDQSGNRQRRRSLTNIASNVEKCISYFEQHGRSDSDARNKCNGTRSPEESSSE